MWIGHRKEIRKLTFRALALRLTLETSAFESLYGGQFTLSTQLIKPNYLVILPTDAAPQFLYKLTPSKNKNSSPPPQKKSHKYAYHIRGAWYNDS